ncbi:hypothetical protein LOOC260_112520 [Paucilactobacillus hokkaidonensis JCM 18461]|uniref:MmcQ/YjbR family DNA-binding protein n=2 Tax=Paucilactobacillus hokkaidonensis TaxID=1193095 RepID=A0A0A1GUW8_9LACO|nr:MmcQ/YjbR family DNA-binding protein [Paucilactobacillus hokkaidonensis]KRO10336.1 hypothetical protein IV59_GL001954 [Paucilactobacillus hokkaidonensis]BAP85790.1 hypothetical protein LOOC260_112520 [Paucilactobacillus hokkaidonensis JCM 18461]
MTRPELIKLVTDYTDSYEDYPFNGGKSRETTLWTVMKQRSSNKIVALIFEKDDQLMIDLKLEPEHGVVMRNYRGVFPGYHMNKTHWNTIRVNDTELSNQELINMIKESDELTKKR